MARPAGDLFTIAIGIAGWAIVIGIGAREPVTPLWWIALFAIVILAARALAFRTAGDRVLSLDSAYYVAATLCVGPVSAGRIVAVALTIDAAVRWLTAQRASEPKRGNSRDALAAQLAHVVYFGGMSGGLVALSGWLWGAGAWVGAHGATGAVALRVVAIAATLLVSHYALQGVRQRLQGRSWRAYLDELALPGIVAEVSLMPIGIVLVLVYDPEQPLGFLLLSLTYLLINLGFARLSRTRKQLEERVHELEILNATARRMAASLQLEELVEAVARETCKAIPEAEGVALVHKRAADAGLVLDVYDRLTDSFVRRPMKQGEGAAGWVMAHAQPRRIGELAVEDAIASQGGVQGIRSWLGVPLFMYGESEGVIAVQSTQPRAFRADHQRLLESLALQIAAALQNAHLYELAMVDGLTGLFVRRYFDARIEEEIERSKRYGTAFSVVMMDVDDFKRLNDTHGHLIGDRVLRGIANVIKVQLRGVDTAARYGGEEIALILPRTELIDAYNVGERVRGAIADLRITTDSTDSAPAQALGVTASFGIAAYPESKASDGEDLVRRADRALYRAKKLGKNRVELYWSDDSGPRAIPEPARAAPLEITPQDVRLRRARPGEEGGRR